jgi:hypothetical protein
MGEVCLELTMMNFKFLWVALGGLALAGGCDSGGDSDASEKRRWECFGSQYAGGQGACGCIALEPGEEAGGSPRAPRCEGYPCCLLSEGQDTNCECLNTEATCEAEAASRPGTEIVQTCPPPDEQEPIACAKEGVNCSASYLGNQGLERCCDGLVCKNTGGVQTCVTGTPEELASVSECKLAGHRPSQWEAGLTVIDPVVTSTDTLDLEYSALHSELKLGQLGCLRSARIRLVGSCSLDIAAGPERDESGALRVSSAVLGPCLLSLNTTQGMTGTLSFRGVECLSRGMNCAAGTWELRLFGGSGDVTFDGTAVRMEGAVCDVSHQAPACE